MDAAANPFTGQLSFILIAAPALALPIAALLLWLYRRAVIAAMERAARAVSGQDAAPEPSPAGGAPVAIDARVFAPGDAAELSGPAAALHRELSRAPWRAAGVQAAAGLAYGATMAIAALLASDLGLLPIRFAVLTLVFAWPAVPAVLLVAAPDRRQTLRLAATYFGALGLASALAVATSSEFSMGQALLLFAIENVPASLLLLAFWMRRVRAVGPLVVGFLGVVITGSLFVLSVAGGSDDFLGNLAAVGDALGFGAVSLFAGLVIAGLFLFAVPGWLLLQGVGVAYRRKWLSDQSVALDAVWLFFAMAHAVLLASEGTVWILSGVAAFASYRAVVAVGGRWLRSRRGDAPVKRLLLLRVFALGRRSEQLFDALVARWQHFGSLQLITGPDLATATLEPHEFLDFLSGRLGSLFIGDRATLERRLAELDLAPDPDGRFRVNEFFCHGDTWRDVLAELVQRSDLVLMDLRGFGPDAAGCRAELGELAARVPLERVTLVVDESTEGAYLDRELRNLLAASPPDSPNRPGPATLRQFRTARTDATALDGLTACLCAAAADGGAGADRATQAGSRSP